MAPEALALGRMGELLALMARLRDPEGGCPWDLAQDFATIAPYTIEEAYEVADAIARRDVNALVDELGDLLFQVVYHAQMAREAELFSFSDVVDAVVEKMVRRHPHVYGDAEIADAEAQTHAWEAHKAAERAAKASAEETAPSVLDGVPLALPALTRAVKLQRRLNRVGFDWSEAGDVLAKLSEELDELRAEIGGASSKARIADELGDVLFSCANLARFLDVDPEASLRAANAKVENRFRRIEHMLAERGRSPAESSLAELEALWQLAKKLEEEPGGESGGR